MSGWRPAMPVTAVASEEAMIVAGIGCGRETSFRNIVSLISVVLSNFGIARRI